MSNNIKVTPESDSQSFKSEERAFETKQNEFESEWNERGEEEKSVLLKLEEQLGYTPADYDKGILYREDNNVRKLDGAKYSLLDTDIFEFGRYGVGLYLYMLYIKHIIIVFAIMTIIAIPAFVSNIGGGYYESRNFSILGFTMLGNQEGFEEGTQLTDGIEAHLNNDTNRYLVIYSDLVNTIFFFLFVYYLKYIGAVAIKEALHKTQTPSDYTLYVTGLPNEYQTFKMIRAEDGKEITEKYIITEKDVEEHFAQYGKIVEITFARKFGKMMKIYKKQDLLNKKIFKREAKIRVMAEDQGKDPDKEVTVDSVLQKLVLQDRQMEKDIRSNYPKIRSYDDFHAFAAFVVFDDVLACNKCFLDYKVSNRILYQNRLKFLDKYQIKCKYADDPVNINWDNLEVSRLENFWRSALTIAFAACLLFITFLVVYAMRSFLNSLADPDNCGNYELFNTNTVDRGNEEAVTCVCINEGFISVLFDTSKHDVCGNYIRDYILRTVITISVSFIVSMINFMIKIVFRTLAKFERYKSLTHETGSIFRKLFVSIFINMAILLLLINANFQSIKFVKDVSDWLPIGGELFFNGRYDDLSREWYPRVGLAFCVLILSTIFSNLFSSGMWEGIRWYKRTIKAKRQILQCDMNVNMLGGVFEMDAKYGMSLALIFLAHLYFGAIPLLCPIMSIYFFVQFWLDKLYITKFARKPPHYQKNLHNTMISIIPYSTFLHCAFSLWAYGNPEIWPSKVEARVENGITRYYPEDRSFSERIFNENSMPHFILLCTLVTIYILELFSENCILKLFRKCLFKKDKLGPNSAINMEQKTFTKMRTRMAKFSQTSYDPELNDAYAKILLAMKDVAIIKKDIDPEALPKADKDSKLKKVKTSEIAYKEYKKKKQMKKKIQDEKLKGKDMEFDPKEEKKGSETSRDDDSEDPLTKKPQRHRKLPKIEKKKNRKDKKNKNKNSNKPKKTPSKPKKNARR
ncbi:unnamed protein product [Moneuplotes crassus]|uniref:CSC1/OSCA1-like cytosolic domain-containing protein n=1 Tax=Euplotes crassus TaxID=5936 RepID=A0AAD2CXU8_EUPCR|nr:unnamed protein product [Moneuplotes crassus]